MPGIFGFASHSLSAAMPAILDGMAGRMMHHSWYSSRTFAHPNGRVGLGEVSLEPHRGVQQRHANGERPFCNVFHGDVYDGLECRLALQEQGDPINSDDHGELLLRGYQRNGIGFFRGLHGQFAAALWDSTTRRLILVNDRFGMKHIYYAHTHNRLLFASAIRPLLVDPSVDQQSSMAGLAQFFTFGQLLGEDTLLRGVRLLPPASVLIYDADTDRVTIDRYWRLSADPNHCSTAETLDRIDTAFCRAVDRTTSNADGLGISLSGGMDARTILALAAKNNRSITALSLGMEGGMDHRSAAAMSKLAGCSHHQVILDDRFLANYASHLRDMVRLTDGHYLCQCIVMPTLPVYRDLGIRVLLRGHAGELMHMSKAYNFSLNSRVLAIKSDAELMNWLWRRLQAYILDGVKGRLFAGACRWETDSLACEALRSSFQETAETQPPAHRIWQLFLAQRLRRETAMSLVEFDSVVTTRLPYLDNELIDELFAAPPELKLDDVIQAHILRKHGPEFMKVVNVNTGTIVGATAMRKRIAKVRMKVLAKCGVKGYQPYERLGLWLRRELRPLVVSLLLSDRCLDRGILEAQTVREVVHNHLAGRQNHTYLLLALLIFETAQRLFSDGDTEPTRFHEQDLAEASAA